MGTVLAAETDLRRIGNAFRLSMALFDRNRKIIYMNNSFAYECGISPKEAIGRGEDLYTDEPMLPDVFLYKRMMCRTFKQKDGYVFLTAIPVFDDDKEICMVGMSMQSEFSLDEAHEFIEALTKQTAPAIEIKNSQKDDPSVLRTLMGNNKNIRELRSFIQQIGPSDASVLITGETGTGKEVAADCIQALSARADKPYIKVNCAAIPAHLLESELFGYEPGAFTGASAKGKAGLLEVASGGTVFLDEIGDMPPELQPKLLRALQHGEVYRIGSTKVRKTDVRIIAATNVDLNKRISAGAFREDLYFRLSVIPVQMPPLRERLDDIILLSKYYLEIFCAKYNKQLPLQSQTLDLMTMYDWPGNIRELQNVMEYYVVCSRDETGLGPEQLQRAFRHPVMGVRSSDGSLSAQVEEYEKAVIESALSLCGSLRKAAKKLDVDPSTLSRKAKKYGIPLND